MRRILFNIGPFSVYSYGVLVAAAFIVSVFLIRRDAVKEGISFDKIMDPLMWVLISGLAGGRLLFIVINSHYFFMHPRMLFAFREGGMAFHGGLLAGVIAALWLLHIKKLDFWRISDLVAPYIALGEGIGRIGCFLNGCCYGKVIQSGLGVTFPGEPHMRIPSQLISSLALVLLYLFLKAKREHNFFHGSVFCLYLILYGVLRFFIEFLRDDNPAVLLNLTLAQIMSVVVAAAGTIAMGILYARRGKHVGT